MSNTLLDKKHKQYTCMQANNGKKVLVIQKFYAENKTKTSNIWKSLCNQELNSNLLENHESCNYIANSYSFRRAIYHIAAVSFKNLSYNVYKFLNDGHTIFRDLGKNIKDKKAPIQKTVTDLQQVLLLTSGVYLTYFQVSTLSSKKIHLVK